MLNQITLIGNLGADSEVKANGQLLQLRLATSTSYKNKQGEYVNETEWHKVKLWSQYASDMAPRFTKGAKVLVLGSVTYEEYEGRKDLVVKARSVKSLG